VKEEVAVWCRFMRVGVNEEIGTMDVEVLLNSICKVTLDIVRGIHPFGNCLHECVCLGLIALSVRVIHVLAGELGNPDRLLECGVEVLDVLDECLSVNIIPVKGNDIDVASITVGNEVLHPDETVGVRGRCW